MTVTDDRKAAKAWLQRNSDGFNTFSDELGRLERTQSPPGFDEAEHALPPGTRTLTTPDDPTLARAIRHTHVYDPSLVEPA